MRLLDAQELVLVAYGFMMLLTAYLGERKHPMFFIFTGIVTIVLGIEIWNISNLTMPNASTIITTVFIGIGCMFIVFGFFAKSTRTKVG